MCVWNFTPSNFIGTCSLPCHTHQVIVRSNGFGVTSNDSVIIRHQTCNLHFLKCVLQFVLPLRFVSFIKYNIMKDKISIPHFDAVLLIFFIFFKSYPLYSIVLIYYLIQILLKSLMEITLMRIDTWYADHL